MSDTFDQPSDETEAYEDLDEDFDDRDRPGQSGDGPEGGLVIDKDLIVDQTELEELGAGFDDPERIAVLDGGIDDPDGSSPPDDGDDAEAGWDVDPVVAADRLDGEEDDDDA
jgi:hypothetical protein